MSEIQALRELYLLLEKRVKDIERLVIKQAEIAVLQSRTIIGQGKRLDGLVGAYHRIQKVVNELAVDHNKKYDDKVDEVTDIIVSRQKYKM